MGASQIGLIHLPTAPVPRSAQLLFVCLISATLSGSALADENQPLAPNKTDTADEVPELVKVMDAALRRWKEEATFTATYRFLHGLALTQEDARNGRFVNPLTGEPYEGESGTGFVAKSPDSFRYVFSVDGLVPSYDPESQSTVFESFDVAVSNGVRGLYRPLESGANGRSFGGNISFGDITALDHEGRFPEVREMITMPLFICGGNKNHLFLSIEPRAGLDEQISWEVQKIDAAHVALVANRRGTFAEKPWENRSQYVLRTDVPYPFLERVEHDHSADGKRDFREISETSRMVDCGNGCLVPSRVVVLTELSTNLTSAPIVGESFWRARIWESDDLGHRQPQDSDFVVEIAERTRVRGLREPHASQLTFDLRALTIDDLRGSPARAAAPPVSVASQGRPRNPRFSWSLAFVALIVIGGLLLAVSIRLAKPRSTQDELKSHSEA